MYLALSNKSGYSKQKCIKLNRLSFQPLYQSNLVTVINY